MSPRRSARLLCRAGTAALLATAAALAGAPAAVADEAPPVVALDPPDAAFFLIPVENYPDDVGVVASTADGATPSLGAAEVAALAPPEIARNFGEEGVSVASHTVENAVDAEYGGTVVVRLPALVDASEVVVSLDVLDPVDEEAEPRHWSSEPGATDPLAFTDLGGNEISVTLPADDGVFGPAALLTLDGLGATDARLLQVFPLAYGLELTPPGAGPVTLEPAIGLFASAGCSVQAEDPCSPTEVRAGGTFDLTVPPTSLLRALDAPRLDTAELSLYDETWDPEKSYFSGEDPSLVPRREAWSASVDLPDDIAPGAYQGSVIGVDPTTGSSGLLSGGTVITLLSFDLEVAAVNPGLRSETGWVDDVREASAGSTKAVAGITMLVVAGLITVVAVAPRRRPPTER